MIDLALLEKIVQSPFLWSILCLIIAIAYYRKNETEVSRLRKQSDSREKSLVKLYEDHKKESNIREEKLMNHLDKTTETLGHIEKGLTKLESKMDVGFKDIWDQIDTLRNGPHNKE